MIHNFSTTIWYQILWLKSSSAPTTQQNFLSKIMVINVELESQFKTFSQDFKAILKITKEQGRL